MNILVFSTHKNIDLHGLGSLPILYLRFFAIKDIGKKGIFCDLMTFWAILTPKKIFWGYNMNLLLFSTHKNIDLHGLGSLTKPYLRFFRDKTQKNIIFLCSSDF